MASTATLTSFLLSTHSNLRIPCSTSQISPKPPLLIVSFQSRKLLCFNPKLQLATAKPTSFLSSDISSLSAQTNISRTITEKIIPLLLRSLIFMGCLGVKTAVAEPTVHEGSQSGSVETGIGGSEDEELYVKLLEQSPKNVEALKMVVNLKMKNGKTKEAVVYLERLIKVQPNELEWRLLQALCYEMMGQLGMAKKLFKDILNQRPLLLRALHV